MVDRIREQYSLGSLLVALEPALPMGYSSSVWMLLPVGRRASNRRAAIMPVSSGRNKTSGLIYFGEFGLERGDWRNLARFTDWESPGAARCIMRRPIIVSFPRPIFPTRSCAPRSNGQ